MVNNGIDRLEAFRDEALCKKSRGEFCATNGRAKELGAIDCG